VPRVARSDLPDGFFHAFSRGAPELAPFPGPDDRTIFLRRFWRCVRRYRWRCLAVVVMTTHYHTVVEATREALSIGIQQLNGDYAMDFNARHGRFGHVFAGRFSARAIHDDSLFDRCEYVVQNPVKAGLCDRADAWPWSYSSYGLGA
jgi:REP element-mobilizing transposase RayT